MIEVKNLTKRYGNHLALDNVSFTVPTGAIVGFLGPNGAGKSTTMNIITGYLSSTEGQVLIDGIDVLEDPLEAKAKIGYLPEMPPLYNDMTVDEYLEFVCELKGLPAAEKESTMEYICKTVRLSEVRGRLIRNLSKGYRQRVGLAQALIGNPEVLILDEPTVGLDPKQIQEFRSLLRNLSQKHTIFLSSHILQEIEAVCDHIIIINHGRIVAVDTPDGLSKSVARIQRVEVRIRGDKNSILKSLQALPGTKKAELTRIREEGSVDVLVEMKEGCDVREDIFAYCVRTNQPILMMKADEANLEEIFLQATEGKRGVR